MTLDISAVTPRVQYTVGSTPDSTFDYSFAIFQDSDISVFVDSVEKTLTTHYTVSGAGTTSGGTVTMTTGNAVSNATVTLVRNITIQRTTDFPASGAFQVDSLNTELDRITAVQQELEDDIGRSLRLADEDATSTLTLPLKDARKGRYLAFNSTTGNAEAGPTQTDVTAIADVTSDIATLADIQDGTTATNAITLLSPKATEIGLLGNSTTVANMGLLGTSAVVTDMGLLGTSAVVTDMDLLATSANITAMGHLGTSANVTAMGLLGTSAVVTDMGLLGTSSNVTAMANLGTSTNVTNMANLNASGVIANIATVAGDTTEINAVAGKATEIGLLGVSDVITDMGLLGVADVITDMGLLATSANVTAMGHLGTSANVTAMGLLGTSAVVEDMGFLGTSANVTAMGHLGTSANVTAMGLLGTSAVVTDMGLLGTSSNVSAMAVLGTADAVSDMNTLSAISSDITSLANSLEKTYTVTVTNPGSGNVFVLDSSNAPAIEVFRGNSYIFNQNDSSNDGHPLVFKNGSSAYEVGITYYLNGSATSQSDYVNTTTFNAGRSSGDRKVIIEVASTAPSSGLRYYCYVHGNGMGNTITVKDSNISLVAGSIANVNTTGGAISNVNIVGGAVSNVNTVATNISSVNDFADKYRIGSSDPSSSLDEGDLFYNTTSNTLKVYNGSAWEAGVTAGSGFAALTGASFTGNISTTGTITIGSAEISEAELEILDGATATTAELNILDGVTASTSEINILDGVTSTTSEINILDGVTATTSELNILDGVTSTTSELNILDGVTSSTAEINALDGVDATDNQLGVFKLTTTTPTASSAFTNGAKLIMVY